MSKKLTKKEVIDKIISIHGNKYKGLNDIVYINCNTPIKLICPKHGEFLITPKSLFKGCGCKQCANEHTSNLNKSNKNEFINKAKLKHNNFYSYEKTNYVNSHTKIIITCPIHGDFEQSPSKHLKGQGCPHCYEDSLITNEEFIKRSNEVHNNFYDYSKCNYVNNHTKVTITCPIHGDFEQLPYVHLNRKCGCKKCAMDNLKNNNTCTQEEFIEKAKKIHGDKYGLDLVNYINSFTKIDVVCKDHGIFSILPSNFLLGYGCRKCSMKHSSEEENEIKNHLKENNINFIENDNTILNGKEIDIYIPDMKIGIEFDGLYWHSSMFVDDKYHLNKTNECYNKGIRLIHIFEDEWIFKRDIVLSRLDTILGINSNIIYARKCIIKNVENELCKKFLNDNHLQGFCVSKYKYGLFYNNELVSLMTFGNLRKNLNQKAKENNYELIRFCNKINIIVVGGASRLFKHFIKEKNPERIITYSDKRWNSGKIYDKLGFNYIRDTKPNYYYVIGHNRENRFKYRKDVLVRNGYPSDKTEKEIMTERKIYRIYDCGNMVFEYKNKSSI